MHMQNVIIVQQKYVSVLKEDLKDYIVSALRWSNRYGQCKESASEFVWHKCGSELIMGINTHWTTKLK